VSSRTTS